MLGAIAVWDWRFGRDKEEYMAIYTLIHTLISLVGIVAGAVMAIGLLRSKLTPTWSAVFFISTALTCLTGFFFPFHGFKPSYVVGVLTLIVLGIAVSARYQHQLAGRWRLMYVVSSLTAFYFNVFVLIVQSFLKIPVLHALAPTQQESPFKLAQVMALVLFAELGYLVHKKFNPPLA